MEPYYERDGESEGRGSTPALAICAAILELANANQS